GFGGEIALNHLVLDGVVALEDYFDIGDAAELGDLPQTVQAALLLEAWEGSLNIDIHARGFAGLRLGLLLRRAIVLHDGVGRERRLIGRGGGEGNGEGGQKERGELQRLTPGVN